MKRANDKYLLIPGVILLFLNIYLRSNLFCLFIIPAVSAAAFTFMIFEKKTSASCKNIIADGRFALFFLAAAVLKINDASLISAFIVPVLLLFLADVLKKIIIGQKQNEVLLHGQIINIVILAPLLIAYTAGAYSASGFSDIFSGILNTPGISAFHLPALIPVFPALLIIIEKRYGIFRLAFLSPDYYNTFYGRYSAVILTAIAANSILLVSSLFFGGIVTALLQSAGIKNTVSGFIRLFLIVQIYFIIALYLNMIVIAFAICLISLYSYKRGQTRRLLYND